MTLRRSLRLPLLVLAGAQACTLDLVDLPTVDDIDPVARVVLYESNTRARPDMIRREFRAWLAPGVESGIVRSLESTNLTFDSRQLHPVRIEESQIVWQDERVSMVAGATSLGVTFPGVSDFGRVDVTVPVFVRSGEPVVESDGRLDVAVSVGPTNLPVVDGRWTLAFSDISDAGTNLLTIHGSMVPPSEISVSRDLLPASAGSELALVVTVVGTWATTLSADIAFEAQVVLEDHRRVLLEDTSRAP